MLQGQQFLKDQCETSGYDKTITACKIFAQILDFDDLRWGQFCELPHDQAIGEKNYPLRIRSHFFTLNDILGIC